MPGRFAPIPAVSCESLPSPSRRRIIPTASNRNRVCVCVCKPGIEGKKDGSILRLLLLLLREVRHRHRQPPSTQVGTHVPCSTNVVLVWGLPLWGVGSCDGSSNLRCVTPDTRSKTSRDLLCAAAFASSLSDSIPGWWWGGGETGEQRLSA